jgi:curved DNA-binding protein CbpA
LVVPGLVADHLENDNKNVDVQLAQPHFESLDPYSVLGVPEQATNRQIKKTYFKLSKQYHPDGLPSLPNQQDAHTTFTLISNAYEFLMDPDKRREHDLTLRSYHTAINNATNNVDDEDSLSEEGRCAANVTGDTSSLAIFHN